MEKTFIGCLLVLSNNATSPNFAEKTFADRHKASKFEKVFSLKGFRYTVYQKPLKYGHLYIWTSSSGFMMTTQEEIFCTG